MGRIHLPIDNKDSIVHDIQTGSLNVYLVSNGSVQLCQAGFVLVLEGTKCHLNVKGSGPCNDNPDAVNLFWAEFLGLLAIAYFLQAI